MSPVTFLEWDTEFFGVSIARAEVEGDTVSGAVEQAVAHGVQCLYLFISNANPPSLEDAMRRGGRLVDLRVTLEVETGASPPVDVRVATSDEAHLLVPLARGLARSSRFRADPRFSSDAVDSMYETWLHRCLRDGVVVIPGETAGGFVGARPDREVLSLDLVYVDPGSRGQSLAARLVQGAIAAAGHSRARVATQAWNIPAQRLYQGLGFRTSSLHAIVHLWLDEPSQPSEATASSAEGAA